MDEQVIKFLKKCKIQFDVEEQLDGQLIPRDILLSKETYNEVKQEIIELKKKFSSSSLTSLQKNAETGQKWPLLNLVRQILKICNYQMKPVRRSNGYSKDGKKKYKRFFLIGKYSSVKTKGEIHIENNSNASSGNSE
tara:strand:+ start:298 stop:708 length:411 start_codon:yes stop_codon:yes gene_type:complete